MRALTAREKRAVEAAARRLFETEHPEYAPDWDSLHQNQRANLRSAIRRPVLLYLEALENPEQAIAIMERTDEVKALMLGLVAAAGLLAGCTDASGATRAVEAMGLTDVRTTGWRLWGCDEKDMFATGFVAKNPRGQDVSGVVCGGWLKNSTVRFD